MIEILVPVSAGELLDKITILRIKAARIADTSRSANVKRELGLLETVAASVGLFDVRHAAQLDALATVNAALWEIEDAIRERDSEGDFGARFVSLARSVYRNNDLRASIKREINLLSGSLIVEEKSYADMAFPSAPTNNKKTNNAG